jgi:hypothetical protein
MAFTKGRSGNPAGRPKGAKDKLPRPIRERLAAWLENDFDKALSDWQELTPSERWQRRASLYEFVLPRLARVEAEVETSTAPPTPAEIDYSKLSDNALREIIAAAGGDNVGGIPLITWTDHTADTD